MAQARERSGIFVADHLPATFLKAARPATTAKVGYWTFLTLPKDHLSDRFHARVEKSSASPLRNVMLSRHGALLTAAAAHYLAPGPEVRHRDMVGCLQALDR